MIVREWRCITVRPAAFHKVRGNSVEGVKDVQGGTVRWSAPACMVDGMSTREAAQVLRLNRDRVRKMVAY